VVRFGEGAAEEGVGWVCEVAREAEIVGGRRDQRGRQEAGEVGPLGFEARTDRWRSPFQFGYG